LSQNPDKRFYVAVAGEPDSDELIADVVFEGEQVADVRRAGDAFVVTLYAPLASNSLTMPLLDFVAALNDAQQRLSQLG
jgi:hypothetical protein